MSITTNDVQRMASLARLEISEETQEIFAKQFGDILGYMETLTKVDTSDLEPLYSPSLHVSPVREDVAHNKRKVEEVLANSPMANEEYFVVPRIV